MRIEALAKDVAEGSWYAVIDFACIDGTQQREAVPRSDLNNPRKVLDWLSDRGCRLPASQKGRLALACSLAAAEPSKQLWLVRRTGWAGDMEVHVFPDRIVGRHAERWILHPRSRPEIVAQTGGSPEGWRRIAELAEHSQYLVFGIGVAFASMLLRPLGIESGIFHLHGTGDPKRRSSIGKTVCGLVATSIFSLASREQLAHWDVTPTGLEELAAAHNDRVLVVDEIARADILKEGIAGKAKEGSFKIAGQRSRLRSRAFDSNGPLTWCVLVLSNGEYGIAELAQGRLKGEEVRFIDVPIMAHPKFGIFRSLPEGYSSSGALVAELEKRCGQHYGHPARAFAERFLADRPRRERFARACMKRFQRVANVPDQGWERRFAERFGLVYAAIRIATKMGILPWTQHQALEAVVSCYRAARGAISDAEGTLQKALADLREALATGDELKLIDLRQAPRKRCRSVDELEEVDGFIRRDPQDGTFYALTSEAIKRVLGPKVTPHVLKRLQGNGHLLTTAGRTSLLKQVLVKEFGPKKRPYACIRAAFVTAGAE
jgi:putative DNA primase/helicase